MPEFVHDIGEAPEPVVDEIEMSGVLSAATDVLALNTTDVFCADTADVLCRNITLQ